MFLLPIPGAPQHSKVSNSEGQPVGMEVSVSWDGIALGRLWTDLVHEPVRSLGSPARDGRLARRPTYSEAEVGRRVGSHNEWSPRPSEINHGRRQHYEPEVDFIQHTIRDTAFNSKVWSAVEAIDLAQACQQLSAAHEAPLEET